MKLLHTADWHLGKRLDHFTRIEEQESVLDEICTIADKHQVDAVLVAGDLFDTYNPPTEAEELFYRILKRLSNHATRPVIAIAGNHDSADRIHAPNPLAIQNGIILAGYPNDHVRTFQLKTGLAVSRSAPGFIELKIPGTAHPLRIILSPYANEFRLRTFLGIADKDARMTEILAEQWEKLAAAYCDENGVNILLSHLFFMQEGGALPEEPDDEKPILHVGGAAPIATKHIPRQVQYAALGHLHRHQVIDTVPCPAVYSSSILGYSFSEAHQTKYAVIIEVEPGSVATFQKIPLSKGKKLLRRKFDDMDMCVQWLKQHQDDFIELTIRTENYLTGEERKRIMQANKHVVTIIPDISDNGEDGSETATLDLRLSIDELFIQYFTHTHGQPPPGSIMDLFREIKSTEAS